MVHVGWLLAGLALSNVPVFMLVRANQALTRALIARNPQEYAAIERQAGKTPKRTVPEREIAFADTPPRPLGL